MEQLINFFQKKSVKTVLDIGTGTGDFISILRRVFPQAEITGVDPNTESLDSALRNYPDVIFREMTAENLDFPDHSFDLVSISMALHHLPDVQKSLHEMQRVVKPKCWILISELFSDNLEPAQEVHKIYHHFKSRIDRIQGISHNNTFKKNEILKMVEYSGIEILFHFDYEAMIDPVKNPEEIEERIEKMREHLTHIEDHPEYEELKLQIEHFRKSSAKHGFRLPTKVVIIGRVI